jgi:hypothetical protein
MDVLWAELGVQGTEAGSDRKRSLQLAAIGRGNQRSAQARHLRFDCNMAARSVLEQPLSKEEEEDEEEESVQSGRLRPSRMRMRYSPATRLERSSASYSGAGSACSHQRTISCCVRVRVHVRVRVRQDVRVCLRPKAIGAESRRRKRQPTACRIPGIMACCSRRDRVCCVCAACGLWEGHTVTAGAAGDPRHCHAHHTRSPQAGAR